MDAERRETVIERWASKIQAGEWVTRTYNARETAKKRADKYVKKAGWRKVVSTAYFGRTALRELARDNRRKGVTIVAALSALDALLDAHKALCRARGYYTDARNRFECALPRFVAPRTTEQLRAERATRAKKALYDAIRAASGYSDHLDVHIRHDDVCRVDCSVEKRWDLYKNQKWPWTQYDNKVQANLDIPVYQMPGRSRDLGTGRLLLDCSPPLLMSDTVRAWNRVAYAKKGRGHTWTLEHGAAVADDCRVVVAKTVTAAMSTYKRSVRAERRAA